MTAGADTGLQADDAADWALIRRIGDGDEGALEVLYRRYYSNLYRFVLRVMRRPECCEEVINDVLYIVWQKAADTEPLSRASTWILGIAHKRALKAIERHTRDSIAVNDSEALDLATTEDMTDQVSTRSLAEKAFALLSPEQRAVMELVYYHGLHYQDIALALQCPENTVKTRMFHARKRLRILWPALTGEVPGAASGTEIADTQEMDA